MQQAEDNCKLHSFVIYSSRPTIKSSRMVLTGHWQRSVKMLRRRLGGRENNVQTALTKPGVRVERFQVAQNTIQRLTLTRL
jgi:hypothetical protein